MRFAALVACALAAALAVPMVPGLADGGFVRQYPYHAGPFTFPRDEDKHDEFLALPASLLGWTDDNALVEWWYVEGHLTADDGHRFAVMAAWFRTTGQSVVHSEAVWDITDVGGDAFSWHNPQTWARNVSRGGDSLYVSVAQSTLRQVEGAPFVYRLTTADGNFSEALDLQLVATAAPILPHGGILPMGGVDSPPTDSWYYALPELDVDGTVTVGGQASHVRGMASMEHQWLDECTCGGPGGYDWDYFTIRLDNGLHAMLFWFHSPGQAVTPRGDVWMPDGTRVEDDAGREQTLGYWQKWPLDTVDPRDPSSWERAARSKMFAHGWQLNLPAEQLDLTLHPTVDDQQTQHGGPVKATTFWEGEAEVTGSWQGQPAHGWATAEILHDSRADQHAPGALALLK